MSEYTIPKALPPHFYIGVNLLVTLCSLYLFYQLGVDDIYFFLPVLALGIFYALLYFIRQCKGNSRFSVESGIDLNTLLKRAVTRYLVWLVVMVAGYEFYLITPPYNTNRFSVAPHLFETFLHWYLWLGIPYFALTLTFKASRVEDFYDPAIRFLHIFKQIGRQLYKRIINKGNRQPVFRVLKKQYNRKVFLNLAMRAYFIPAMTINVIPTTSVVLKNVGNIIHNHHYLAFLAFLSTTLWLLDTLNATTGYLLETRWLENRSRSIDLTIGGWMVCLSCYSPFNEATSSIFTFTPALIADGSGMDAMIINSASIYLAFKTIELLALSTHIYADSSLGPSTVNITLKKLQTRGLYGLVRHPGTATKLLLWFIQSCLYKKFWTAKFLFGHVGWMTIYVLRALTEERHLKKFAEYREYCKKVKHRFFPGLF